MVITVNGSCGLTAAASFNHSISSVANSISKHSLGGSSNRNNNLTNSLTNNLTNSLTSLANNRSISFSSHQAVNSNQHLHTNASYHSYLTTANTAYSGHRALNDELNVLTNMYQPTTAQHITQNSMPSQLDLNSLSNQQLDHNSIDQLHHSNSSFALNNLAHGTQSHLIDQSTLHQFNDTLHDSSLNAPELSYDFSRLISSRSKRKCTNDESNDKNKSSPQVSHSETFETNQKKMLKNDSHKQQLNDQRNQSPSTRNCQLTNRQMNNFLNASPTSPNSAASEFNQVNSANSDRLNTGLLAIAGTLNSQTNSGLMMGISSNDKNTPISTLIHSSALASNNSSLQSTYAQHQSNSLKLHFIKTEPDEQQRDFSASVCTSDNNSIYSPGALSNSTELTGYPSPTHNLLFGHILNDKEHDTHTEHQSNNSIGVSSTTANLVSSLSSAAAGSISNASMHSAASSLMDSMTGNSMNTNRFFNQCSNLSTPNNHSATSKLLLKPSTANSMSIGLSNGSLQHHHSSNVLSNSNGGTMNMLGGMMGNSSNTSGLLAGGPLSAGSTSSSVSSALNGGKKHHVDKHSDEYKRRRERNNIAVRKSREKAKQRSRETEKKVNELYSENDSLKQKLSLVSKECRVLRQLLTNYGVLPEVIERELASILKSDELQQQLLQQQTAAAQHQQGHQLQQLHQQTNSAAIHQSVAHQHLQQLQQQTNLFQQLHPAAHFSHNQSQHLSHY